MPFRTRDAVGGIMLDQNNNSDRIGETDKKCRIYSPTIASMMREVLHALGNIDFQHDAELEQLEKSSVDEGLKNDIRGKMLARHRKRRGPYMELKHQHRLASAA
jgi:hypothetical protein